MMKRVFLAITISAVCVLAGAPAQAENSTCANADFTPMGQRREDSIPANANQEQWYKVRLFPDRSYAMIAWQPFTDPSEGPVVMSLDWFADNCTGPIFVGLAGSSFREGVPVATGHAGDYLAAIVDDVDCPTPDGCTFRVRLTANGGVSGATTHFLITDTTLSSPYWQVATSASYDAAPQLRNNVNNSTNVLRFIAYNASGTKVCTFDSLPNENGLVTFGMSSTCGFSSGFGSAVVLHIGPPGTVTGNITTFSGASGLSFDAAFSPLQVQHIIP